MRRRSSWREWLAGHWPYLLMLTLGVPMLLREDTLRWSLSRGMMAVDGGADLGPLPQRLLGVTLILWALYRLKPQRD